MFIPSATRRTSRDVGQRVAALVEHDRDRQRAVVQAAVALACRRGQRLLDQLDAERLELGYELDGRVDRPGLVGVDADQRVRRLRPDSPHPFEVAGPADLDLERVVGGGARLLGGRCPRSCRSRSCSSSAAAPGRGRGCATAAGRRSCRAGRAARRRSRTWRPSRRGALRCGRASPRSRAGRRRAAAPPARGTPSRLRSTRRSARRARPRRSRPGRRGGSPPGRPASACPRCARSRTARSTRARTRGCSSASRPAYPTPCGCGHRLRR